MVWLKTKVALKFSYFNTSLIIKNNALDRKFFIIYIYKYIKDYIKTALKKGISILNNHHSYLNRVQKALYCCVQYSRSIELNTDDCSKNRHSYF